MRHRAPLFLLASLTLAACGGSFGSSNAPELPPTTDNARALASAYQAAT